MKRIIEIDFARAIAMLSVIMIHVTSTYIHYKSGFTIFDMNVAFVLNQITRFAVPFFVLLSGISLELGKEINSLKQFYKHRLMKIGIPYCFWCTVYYLYNNHLDFSTISIRSFLENLASGQAAPHLYFMIILMQLYLLFPILKYAVERWLWPSVFISFIITYTIQKQIFFLMFHVDLIPTSLHSKLWMLFPTWLFYFIIGITLTKQRLSKVRDFARKNACLILTVTTFFSILYVLESRITGSLESIKPSLILFVFLILLSSFGVWKFIGSHDAVQKATGFLAKHSLTIYFEHVLVLYFYRHFSIFRFGMLGMILLYIAVVVTATLLAILIDGFLQMLKTKIIEKHSRHMRHTETVKTN